MSSILRFSTYPVFLVALALGAPAGAEQTPKDQSLEAFTQRCADPDDQTAASRATADWDNLLKMGLEPEEILVAAGKIPEDCDYISFKTAILGVRNLEDAVGRNGERAEQRAVEKEKEEKVAHLIPCEQADNCNEVTSERIGVRGLQRRYHKNYNFGMGNLVACGVAFSIGTGIFIYIGTEERAATERAAAGGLSIGCTDCFLYGLLGVLPAYIVAGVAGTIAGISAAIVDENRQPLGVVAVGRPHLPQVTFQLTPGGLVVRF